MNILLKSVLIILYSYTIFLFMFSTLPSVIDGLIGLIAGLIFGLILAL